MRILAIETSCDETAVAVVEGGRRPTVVINRVASQIDLHRSTGGIVPEVAARAQLEALLPLLDSGRDYQPFDLIAVTAGPGLVGSLLVGVETALTLGALWSVPVWGLHHLEGHIYAATLPPARPVFPLLALIVSGGHTELVLMAEHFHYEIVGRTRDDAAGECFDKIARLLGLGYPGGPAIAAAARGAGRLTDPLPRPMLLDDTLDFSFAGLKTAVYYRVRDRHLTARLRSALAAESQRAIVEVLLAKTSRALDRYHPRTLILAGGVSANRQLRRAFTKLAAPKLTVLVPPPDLTTDNAAMIGLAAWWRARRQCPPPPLVAARPRWPLTDLTPN